MLHRPASPRPTRHHRGQTGGRAGGRAAAAGGRICRAQPRAGGAHPGERRLLAAGREREGEARDLDGLRRLVADQLRQLLDAHRERLRATPRAPPRCKPRTRAAAREGPKGSCGAAGGRRARPDARKRARSDARSSARAPEHARSRVCCDECRSPLALTDTHGLLCARLAGVSSCAASHQHAAGAARGTMPGGHRQRRDVPRGMRAVATAPSMLLLRG